MISSWLTERYPDQERILIDKELIKPIGRKQALSLEDDRSLENMFKDDSFLKERLHAVANEVQSCLPERDFKRRLGPREDFQSIRRVRMQFWHVYNQAIQHKRKRLISAADICLGVMGPRALKKTMEDDFVCTYIFTQPHDIKVIQRDILYEGYQYLEEIMDLPIVKQSGDADNSLISHKIKIIAMMEDRVNGSIVQRSQTYSEQISKFEGNKGESKESLQDLRDQINLLKTNLGQEVDDAIIVESSEVADHE